MMYEKELNEERVEDKVGLVLLAIDKSLSRYCNITGGKPNELNLTFKSSDNCDNKKDDDDNN